MLDHLKGDRWSIRVSIKGKSTVLGMRDFSIQNIAIRQYSAEPLFFSHLELYDILVPKYVFANIEINGESWGVMALEERASKELLERNRRREGPIFRFNDKPKWNVKLLGNPDNLGTNIYETHYNLALVAYDIDRIRSKKMLHDQYTRALFLLEGWREKSFKAAECF